MGSVIRIKQDGSRNGLQACSVVPPEAVLSGNADESGEVHFSGSGNTVGVWECTPYAEILDYPDIMEFCYVIQGKVALTNPDGSVETFTAGDCYVVPAGFKGRFEVLETLRKLYVISPAEVTA